MINRITKITRKPAGPVALVCGALAVYAVGLLKKKRTTAKQRFVQDDLAHHHWMS